MASLSFGALEECEKTFHAPGASSGMKKVGFVFARRLSQGARTNLFRIFLERSRGR
jgi:hypothetical protein